METKLYEHNTANDAYVAFLKIFLYSYENFPKLKLILKQKNLLSPWMTVKRTVKIFKEKAKLYDKFLKKKTFSNEKIYKTYKNLFEIIKFKSKKKKYYADLITKYKNNIKKHGM